MNTEQQQAAFEVWSAQFDHYSDEYQDMGADQYFVAGYQAALESPEVQALRDALEEMIHRAHPADMVGDFPRQKLIEAREQARAALGEAK